MVTGSAAQGRMQQIVSAYSLGWLECYEWMAENFPHMDTLHPSWLLESSRARMERIYHHWPDAFEDDTDGEEGADCED